ncbi:MAG: archaeoflavoprotein AfpA [Candidatus Odinarchaeota archaeon]
MEKLVKIVWGITGAGDRIQQTVKVLIGVLQMETVEITVIVSKAGEQVLKWYRLWEKLNEAGPNRVKVEVSANNPFIAGPLQTGKYKCLIVAPATANTVAKIVNGIADTIITNMVAQANKTSLDIFILPVDRKKEIKTTILPNKKTLELTVRDVDVENCEKLSKMPGITVLERPEDILPVINGLI